VTFPTRPLAETPTVTVGQMREVDRLMIEEAGISLLQMMENAGRSLAALVMSRHGDRTVTVLAGSGGNGGGGLVAARHLANRGRRVSVTVASTGLSPVAQLQFDIVSAMGIAITDEPEAGDLVIDALVGYSLRGDPRGRVAKLIEWANGQASPVVALDVPSGVAADTGEPRDPAVRAATTLTIALPKAGLAYSRAVGDLFLTDISVPATVYRAIGVDVPADLFASGQVVGLV
jgi:NAD(P)H-hydrate epimerase